MERFRALFYALKIGNPSLRSDLLKGDLLVELFVKMSEEELAEDSVKERRRKEAEYIAETKRTDQFREKEMNRTDKVRGDWKCLKCGSVDIS